MTPPTQLGDFFYVIKKPLNLSKRSAVIFKFYLVFDGT